MKRHLRFVAAGLAALCLAAFAIPVSQAQAGGWGYGGFRGGYGGYGGYGRGYGGYGGYGYGRGFGYGGGGLAAGLITGLAVGAIGSALASPYGGYGGYGYGGGYGGYAPVAYPPPVRVAPAYGYTDADVVVERQVRYVPVAVPVAAPCPQRRYVRHHQRRHYHHRRCCRC